MTGAGFVIDILLLLAAFVAGVGVGSFNTKRKAKAIMETKGWITNVKGGFESIWNDVKNRF